MLEIQCKSLAGHRFIDLFAGIGGFHYALASLGAECVFASEWDAAAAAVYAKNHHLEPAGDITKISEQEIPAHSILCGGFPCQAFSISGKQLGFEDTRGTLFFDIARILAHHQPEVVFLENVKNLVRHQDGATLNTILLTLADLGYHVSHEILNASHFGLPQNRQRVYIVGFRDAQAHARFQFPHPTHEVTSLADLLETKPVGAKIIDRPDMTVDPAKQAGKGVFPNRPLQIGFVNKGGQGERIYDPAGHAITLSAYGGGIGSKTGLYLVNGVVRKLTPRECARLQGFPEEFQVSDSVAQCYKQFGNSVSINVLQRIAENIGAATAPNRTA